MILEMKTSYIISKNTGATVNEETSNVQSKKTVSPVQEMRRVNYYRILAIIGRPVICIWITPFLTVISIGICTTQISQFSVLTGKILMAEINLTGLNHATFKKE